MVERTSTSKWLSVAPVVLTNNSAPGAINALPPVTSTAATLSGASDEKADEHPAHHVGSMSSLSLSAASNFVMASSQQRTSSVRWTNFLPTPGVYPHNADHSAPQDPSVAVSATAPANTITSAINPAPNTSINPVASNNDESPTSPVIVPPGDGILYSDLDTNAIVPIPVVSGSGGGGSGSGSATSSTGGSQSAGLIINVTYDSSVANAPAGFEADIAEGVQFFESEITTPVTLNIDVGYGEIDGQALAGNALGESESYLIQTNYSTLRNALIANATSAADLSAIASLPATDPTKGAPLFVTYANAQALGLSAGGVLDGYVGFATSGFDYNDNGATVSGYDFLGVVEHELSEVMGRITLDGNLQGGYSTEDLFHYSAPGVRDFSGTTPGYFSVNGGVTNLNSFNTNPGGDFGDWSGATNDAVNAYSSPNVINAFSAVDLTVMDAIGYNLVSSSSSPPPVTTTVTAISETPASGDLGIGKSVTISLTMSAAVTVTGIPTLTLDDNGTATYTGGSGTSTITFTYIAQAGQNAAALAVSTVNLPNGAAISDSNNLVANLSVSGLVQAGPTIDTTAPNAPVIVSDSLSAGAVTLTGTAEANSTITVFDGTGMLGTAQTNSSDNWSYATGTLSPASYTFTATATDAAGNVSTTSAPFSQTINAAPTSDAAIVLRNADGSVSLWEMNGTESLAQVNIGSAPGSWQIEGVGSFGGTGGSDILWENVDGSAGIWQMNGIQVLAETGIGQASSGWQVAGVGNFTGTGMNDIVWDNSSGTVGVWEMNGGQVVAEAGIGQASSGWQIEGVGNFGGTGTNDILWENTSGLVATWQMNGTQITAESVVGQAASGWQFAGIGDFNGNGTSDILWQNTNGSLAIWQMSNNQIASETIIGQAASGSQVAGIGDFNGDGKSDILFKNTSGALAIWEMNGTQILSETTIGQVASGTQVAAVETNSTATQNSLALLGNFSAAGFTGTTASSAAAACETNTQGASATEPLLVAAPNHV